MAETAFANIPISDVTREADRVVRSLVAELNRQHAWVDVIAVGEAIHNVRRQEADLERERRHLSGEEPFGAGVAISLPEQRSSFQSDPFGGPPRNGE